MEILTVFVVVVVVEIAFGQVDVEAVHTVVVNVSLVIGELVRRMRSIHVKNQIDQR